MLAILSLLVAVVAAVPPTAFTPVFSRPSATTLGMSIATPPVGQTIFFGWKTATGALFPSDAIICAPNFVATCLDVSCTAANTCQTRAATILTTNAVTATSISIVRAFVGTTTLAEGTPMYLIWDTAATPAAPVTLTADQAQSRANWSSYDVALPAFTPTTTPTFPINFTRPSETTLSISMPTPPAGQTIFFGWRSAEIVGFPADAVICAPSFVATCLDVSCTAAATCATRPATIFSANTVTATSVALTRTMASGAAPIISGGRMWLAYATAATTAGTTVLDAASAQNRVWSYYTADVPAFTPTTLPTFPINITRKTDTTLSVSVPTPPASQTIFFGWRSGESIAFPTDVVICAPGFVATCLDVSCTAAATCATRATSIFTENTVTATSVALTRTLASGNAPIVAGSKMWLAYNTAATATGTTTLTAASAQSRTWSYYSADVPAVGSDAKMYIPTLIAALCALLCVL